MNGAGGFVPPVTYGGSDMKFSQEFTGVIDGEIYPRVFAPGEDCPPELLDAAKSVGALEKPAVNGSPTKITADVQPRKKGTDK